MAETGRYRFELITSAAVRFSVAGNPVLETSLGDGNQSYITTLDLAAGNHAVQLAPVTGSFASIVLKWRYLGQPADCTDNTFCVSYFANTELSGEPVLETVESHVSHNWGYNSPGQGVPADGFSARWEGSFDFSADTYLFRLTGDDGVRLWLNEELIFDAWRDQEAVNLSRHLTLPAGRHALRLEYYESGFEAQVYLDWRPVNKANQTSAIGVNVHDLNYWSTEWTLLDIFKMSGGWFTQSDDSFDTAEQAQLDLDANGWVRSLPAADDSTRNFRYVAALMLQGNTGAHPAGQYTVLYDGDGSIEYQFDGVYNETLSQPGRHILDVDEPSDRGILLRITATDPKNYIRNIRVIMPGAVCDRDPYQWCNNDGTCSGTTCLPFSEVYTHQRFHPQYLNDLRRYRVIRFLDFFRTNLNETSAWEDRPQMREARWNRWEQGAPYELGMELVNLLNAEPWVNMPALADDGFVRNFAEVVKSDLNEGLPIYLEYGNEIWNTAFLPGFWVEDLAVARWPNSDAEPFTKRMNYHGMRTTQITATWKEMLGEDRVIGVLGGFHTVQAVSEAALDCPLYAAENGGVPCYQNLDALAIGPYFGGYLGSNTFAPSVIGWASEADGGLETLFREITEGGPLYDPNQEPEWERAPQAGAMDEAMGNVTVNKNLADQRGLRLIAYEAGQHLVGIDRYLDDTTLNNLFFAANRDARMGQLYTDYLNGWRERGGELMCMFLSVQLYDRFGSWGLKEYQTQEGAPKFEATMAFIENTPCWWTDCTR
nr:PA14 domain-containing protein [Acanthopleuribacter pedis]